MSIPGGYGGRGMPPLQHAAQDTIQAARRGLDPRAYGRLPVPPPLSDAERAEAQEASLLCGYCAAIHPLPSTPACPRIASCEVNGDGAITRVAFWKPGEWEYEHKITPRVLAATAIAEVDSDG